MADSEEEEISHDELTGLADRRGLRQDVDRLRSRRVDLALFDLDGFIYVNHHFGHERGDEVLRDIAGRLNKRAAEHGFRCYRYGGDEFFCLTDGPDFATFHAVCRDFTKEVEAMGAHTGRSEKGRLTMSCGVGVVESFQPESLDRYIREMDESLYQGKTKASGAFVEMNLV